MLDRLQQYKEFIAILIFFIGGFLWIHELFAKKEELEELRCLNNLSDTVLASNMQRKFLMDEWTQRARELERLSEKADRTPAESEMKIRIKNEIEMLRERTMYESRNFEEATRKIQEQACSKS